MARIQSTSRSEAFSKLDQESNARNESSDCSVKALSLVCGISYYEAHATCRAFGRKDRNGMKMLSQLAAMLAKHGYSCQLVDVRAEFINQYPTCHQILKSVTTHHPARFPKVWRNGKTYLMFTSGHVAAIINGRTHDWTEGRACRSCYLYEITKLGAQA